MTSQHTLKSDWSKELWYLINWCSLETVNLRWSFRTRLPYFLGYTCVLLSDFSPVLGFHVVGLSPKLYNLCPWFESESQAKIYSMNLNVQKGKQCEFQIHGMLLNGNQIRSNQVSAYRRIRNIEFVWWPLIAWRDSLVCVHQHQHVDGQS